MGVSNEMLKSMRRDYSRDDMLTVIDKLNQQFIGVHSHMIIGYPNVNPNSLLDVSHFLNDSDINDLLEDIKYLMSRVNSCTFFRYEEIDGTVASTLPYRYSDKEKDRMMSKVK